MTTRRKGAKEEAAQDFSPWTLSIRSSLSSARTLRRLKSPLFKTSALNPWFEFTHAEPDGIVAGEWPELGTMLPEAEEAASSGCRCHPFGRLPRLDRQDAGGRPSA